MAIIFAPFLDDRTRLRRGRPGAGKGKGMKEGRGKLKENGKPEDGSDDSNGTQGRFDSK